MLKLKIRFNKTIEHMEELFSKLYSIQAFVQAAQDTDFKWSKHNFHILRFQMNY